VVGLCLGLFKEKAYDSQPLYSIDSASQIEEQVVPVEEEKKDEKKEEEAKTDGATPMETDDSTPPATPAPGAKTKKVIKKHDLIVVPDTYTASAELLKKWTDEEGQLHAADRLVIDTAERRNALEEYVYETRSKLEMAWTEFVTDADRSTFLKALNAMEDWLYGEGEEETKSTYIAKLAELKKTGDPIARRYRENDEIPVAEKQFRDYVNSVIVNVSAGDDRYAHIAKEELDKVTSECQVKLNWLNDSIAKRNEQPKHVDPPVSSERILKERENLQFFVNPILNKPKPAPAPAPKKEDEAKKEEGKKEEPKAEEPPKAAEEMDVD